MRGWLDPLRWHGQGSTGKGIVRDGSVDEILHVVWIGCGAAQGPMAQRWLFMTFLLSDALPSGGQHRGCVARKGGITFPRVPLRVETAVNRCISCCGLSAPTHELVVVSRAD